MARFIDLKSFLEHAFADIAVAKALWRLTEASARIRPDAIPSLGREQREANILQAVMECAHWVYQWRADVLILR